METETEYAQAVAASHIPGDAIAAIVDDWSMPETAETVADLEDRWLGEAETPEAWAQDWLEDTNALGAMPEDLRHYFDYKAWLHDAVVGGDISIVRTTAGVGVFHD